MIGKFRRAGREVTSSERGARAARSGGAGAESRAMCHRRLRCLRSPALKIMKIKFLEHSCFAATTTPAYRVISFTVKISCDAFSQFSGQTLGISHDTFKERFSCGTKFIKLC